MGIFEPFSVYVSLRGFLEGLLGQKGTPDESFRRTSSMFHSIAVQMQIVMNNDECKEQTSGPYSCYTSCRNILTWNARNKNYGPLLTWDEFALHKDEQMLVQLFL